uniref:Uncharacterized protein n=2 Tax=Myripristis murdjan TaxID=586833 RepID=A0A667WGG4_9TELE
MEETKIIQAKARRIYNAIQLYNILMTEHGGTLKDYITQLSCIADNLDKVSKGTKIAGITGGAAGVAGGVAAAGLVLAPFTLGASLALTVVGVGVAAAGGATAASAAIANQVTVTQDKKKIESIFQEYEALMEEIQDCLKFISEGLEHLREHDTSTLRATRAKSPRVTAVAQLATSDRASARAMEANSKASGVMHGFALGMFFTQKKGGAKVKKGLESKLAEKIRTVVEEMKKGLDELMHLKELFSEFN